MRAIADHLIRGFTNRYNGVLLGFLLLLLHVSLLVKVIGIIWILSFNRKAGFKTWKNTVPMFYFIMPVLCTLLVVFNLTRGGQYAVLGGLSISYWLAALVISMQLLHTVKTTDLVKCENTLALFFILNALVSGIQFLLILFEIKSINPYVYDGLHFKYATSTGDYIKGITQDISTTNMFINALGLFYFLYRQRYAISALCFLIVLLTTSNLGNFIVLAALIWILCCNSNRMFKSIALCYIALLITFIFKISPTNLNYLNTSFKSIFGIHKDVFARNYHDESEKERRIAEYLKSKYGITSPSSKKQNVIRHLQIQKNTKQVQSLKWDSIYSKSEVKKIERFEAWYLHFYHDSSYLYWTPKIKPAKLNAMRETFLFSTADPFRFIWGTGPACFSSKLAFKASGINIAGSYPKTLVYIAPEFKQYHLKASLAVLTKPIGEHSVINFPNSVYNQLLGEYGILGILLFIMFYIGYFIKRWRLYRAGKLLLPMCLLFLATDYWFEAFSVLVIFELMMYLDARHTSNTLSRE